MLLVDTSVWIDFFNDNKHAEITFLENSIKNRIDISYCGVILTEILQGIKTTKDYVLTKKAFTSFTYLEMHEEIFIEAADIFRKLQRKGITIRKTMDCLIAAVAIVYQTPLLHRDRDFDPIVRYCGLKTP